MLRHINSITFDAKKTKKNPEDKAVRKHAQLLNQKHLLDRKDSQSEKPP